MTLYIAQYILHNTVCQGFLIYSFPFLNPSNLFRKLINLTDNSLALFHYIYRFLPFKFFQIFFRYSPLSSGPLVFFTVTFFIANIHINMTIQFSYAFGNTQAKVSSPPYHSPSMIQKTVYIGMHFAKKHYRPHVQGSLR